MLAFDQLVSIVIPNYNYADYLGAAIDSALAIEWRHVEVIVVDDGSTDASRRVIDEYGARIRSILQSNAGQAVACQAGFALSLGDVVIFLDSDDLLDPGIVLAIAPHWTPATSKAQFRMRTIDAAGVPLGSTFPQFYRVPDAAEIRDWALRTGAYPTPPGSGNAYARAFLQQVMPGIAKVDSFSDTALVAAAPFLGDVLTVADRPLVSYRVHGKNDGAMATLDVSRFPRELARARRRFAYARTVATEAGYAIEARAIEIGLQTLVYRVCALRLPGECQRSNESLASICADTMRSSIIDQGYPWTSRLALIAWIALVGILPRRAVLALIRWRFVPTSRPDVLRKAMHMFRIARA